MQKIRYFIITILLCIVVQGAVVVYAQNPQGHPQDMRHKILNTFHKRVYNHEYPLREIPVATSQSAHQTRKAPNRTASFTDRVWFPGEWEEVKAIILTPYYSYLVPSHEDDAAWYASPIAKEWADYYHYSEKDGWQLEGLGPYLEEMDTTSNFGKVFFRLMDGIQKGGAEAWVRLNQPSDTVLVYETLRRMNLRHDHLRFFYGPCSSIWYRDCGPICFYYGDEDRLAMLDFIYSRHRRPLDDSIPSLLHRQMGIPNYMNKVKWEGGNCLVDGAGTVISSDAVYTINNDTIGQLTWDGNDINSLHYVYKPALTPEQVRQALHDMLGQRETHIIPRYKFDGSTGHVDLYVDAYNENGFVFSVMPDKYSSWVDYQTGHSNIDLLCQQKSIFDRNFYTMARLPFPSMNNGLSFADEETYNAYYARTYSNHCFVNDVILQPCFSKVGADGMPTAAWDRANIEVIKAAYPGYTIYCIDVREFDGSGGALHCVTKQIPADNPVRILHKNIHGSVNLGSLTSIPVSAVITNRSGIAHAEVVYRDNGGDWQKLGLTANGNRFYGSIPVNMTEVPHSVEYYISATSNNGKTMTKPITAHQGGYFSFTYNDGHPNYDSTMFDFDTDPMPMERITFPLGTDWLTEDTSEDQPLPTGIENVQRSMFDVQHSTHDGWFDMQGRMFSTQPTQKGIYIYGNKKIVIK